ncbi:gamma carbonic anhydrase family protein [Haloimpatiens lingqiaonensis]|uniref:gamma carbonic anhydrase family protein n=1 Tax=Haloimpatiens lingqiaonensis TaxID=1380675 RepID=UPI0010FE0CA6|nr:gamma carbonic anhydrase family protein [Haloimpatiens lingqiaonensis]
MLTNFKDKNPNIQDETFIAPSADIIGDVTIEEGANIWYGAVLRGDTNKIYIGRNTNIQDNSVVHVDVDKPCIIGDGVTVGHRAIIHGCIVKDNVLVGMGATILNGAEIGENTIIGAGSLVTQNKKIPSGVLCMGVPAKVVRELTEEEIEGIKKSAQHYVELSKEYGI